MIQNQSEFKISDSVLFFIDSVPAFYNFCPLLNAFKKQLNLENQIKCDSIESVLTEILIIRKDISNRIRVIQRSEIKKEMLGFDFLSIKFAKKIKYQHNIFLFVNASALTNIKKQFIVKFDENANILNCYFSLVME